MAMYVCSKYVCRRKGVWSKLPVEFDMGQYKPFKLFHKQDFDCLDQFDGQPSQSIASRVVGYQPAPIGSIGILSNKLLNFCFHKLHHINANCSGGCNGVHDVRPKGVGSDDLMFGAHRNRCWIMINYAKWYNRRFDCSPVW